MNDKDRTIWEITDKILEIINANSAGLFTTSDLQGAIQAQVQQAYQAGEGNV